MLLMDFVKVFVFRKIYEECLDIRVFYKLNIWYEVWLI